MKSKKAEIYSIDFYAYTSNLKNWNAAFKAIISFSALLICILANKNHISIIIALSMSAITVYKGGLKISEYIRLLLIPLSFLIMGTIPIGFDFAFTPLNNSVNFNVFNFYIVLTYQNINLALKVLLKSFGAVCSMYMLVLSTTPSEIITLLGKLHIPKIIVQLMNMTYRFIFILIKIQSEMRCAAQSRLGFCDFKTSCYTFGHIASNLLLVSFRRANIYYDALVSRCYDGNLSFLEEEKQITSLQVIAAIAYNIALIALCFI